MCYSGQQIQSPIWNPINSHSKSCQYDLKLSWWQYALTSSLVISDISVESVSDISETVSLSIMRGCCHWVLCLHTRALVCSSPDCMENCGWSLIVMTCSTAESMGNSGSNQVGQTSVTIGLKTSNMNSDDWPNSFCSLCPMRSRLQQMTQLSVYKYSLWTQHSLHQPLMMEAEIVSETSDCPHWHSWHGLRKLYIANSCLFVESVSTFQLAVLLWVQKYHFSL